MLTYGVNTSLTLNYCFFQSFFMHTVYWNMILARIIHHGMKSSHSKRENVSTKLIAKTCPEASITVHISASLASFISPTIQHVRIDALCKQNCTKMLWCRMLFPSVQWGYCVFSVFREEKNYIFSFACNQSWACPPLQKGIALWWKYY